MNSIPAPGRVLGVQGSPSLVLPGAVGLAEVSPVKGKAHASCFGVLLLFCKNAIFFCH